MTGSTPQRVRRTCAAAVAAGCAAAALSLAAAPSAAAAIPPPGSIVSQASTATQFVAAAPGTACAGEVSSGSFLTVAGTVYGSPVRSRVGQRFWVKVTVANVSTCESGAGIALQLPAGVELSSTGFPGPSGAAVVCKRLDPTSRSRPVNETIFRAPECPQGPAAKGVLLLNPPGFVGWGTRPSSNFAQNQVEITVWLRASTPGVKTFTAPVCDLQGSTCTGFPPRNVSHTISAEILP